MLPAAARLTAYRIQKMGFRAWDLELQLIAQRNWALRHHDQACVKFAWAINVLFNSVMLAANKGGWPVSAASDATHTLGKFQDIDATATCRCSDQHISYHNDTLIFQHAVMCMHWCSLQAHHIATFTLLCMQITRLLQELR